jgi:hypothetical protein
VAIVTAAVVAKYFVEKLFPVIAGPLTMRIILRRYFDQGRHMDASTILTESRRSRASFSRPGPYSASKSAKSVSHDSRTLSFGV